LKSFHFTSGKEALTVATEEKADVVANIKILVPTGNEITVWRPVDSQFTE
jgi:hypothetical protein